MAFKLPANWYREVAEELIDNELPPFVGPLTDSTAWKYIYACVLWVEKIDGEGYLHLNDRLSTVAGKELARRGEEYLAANLFLSPPNDLHTELDRIAKRYAAERKKQGLSETKWQRNNVTGNSFEATLQVLIHRLTGALPSRSPDIRTLRGFELAPRGYHSRPDLALFTPQDFRVLISTKWTMRKERLGTFLHEAYYYRRRRADLQVAFVVSEFNLNILDHLVHDPLVDRAYHVHLPMLLSAHEPFRELASGGSVPKAELLDKRRKPIADYARWISLQERLLDLSQLFEDIRTLQAAEDEPPDPAGDETDQEEDE